MAVTSIFYIFFIIVPLLRQVLGGRPNVFTPVSNATCQSAYGWMNNAEQQSPCLTVAYVIAACVGNTWTQPALPSGYSYDSPDGTTATPCYCSWSCYNLIMACTLCQNPAYTGYIKTWPAFSQNCPSSYTEEVFPTGYVLDNNVSIPYWATINPTTWSFETFDIGQAMNYSNQNHSYYWPSNSRSNSNTPETTENLGAIVGGAVGGAIGLLLILIGGYLLYRRWHYRRLRGLEGVPPIPQGNTPMTTIHTRWPSESSTVLQSTISGMSAPGMGPGVARQSYPFQHISPPPPTETSSFLTTGNTVIQRTRAIPMV